VQGRTVKAPRIRIAWQEYFHPQAHIVDLVACALADLPKADGVVEAVVLVDGWPRSGTSLILDVPEGLGLHHLALQVDLAEA
jgi:hypothetical protein